MVGEMINGTYRQTNLPNESEEYLSKREELRRAEIELRNQRERVAELRRQLPQGPAVQDYLFEEVAAKLDEGDSPIRTVRLSHLFTSAEIGLSCSTTSCTEKTDETLPDVHRVDRRHQWRRASPCSKPRSGDRCGGRSGKLCEPCSHAGMEQAPTPECRLEYV